MGLRTIDHSPPASTSLSASISVPLPVPFARASADALPNELLLSVFPLLPLTALAAAYAVSRRWRALVGAAPLLPARRRLLKVLVEGACAHPGRNRTRVCRKACCAHRRGGAGDREDGSEADGWSEDGARRGDGDECTFDREAYLRLLQAASRVPDEFVCWVREWPARAVWAWARPGVGLPLPLSSPRPRAHSKAEADASRSGEDAQQQQGHQRHQSRGGRAAPYVRSVTFRGGAAGSGADAGSGGQRMLHATKILPVELSGVGVRHDVVGREDGYGEDADTDGAAAEETSSSASSYTSRLSPTSTSSSRSSLSTPASSANASPSPPPSSPYPNIKSTNTDIETTLLMLGQDRVYVLDGQGGGEALVGRVYTLRGSCYTLRPEWAVARSWAEFLELGVGAGEEEEEEGEAKRWEAEESEEGEEDDGEGEAAGS